MSTNALGCLDQLYIFCILQNKDVKDVYGKYVKRLSWPWMERSAMVLTKKSKHNGEMASRAVSVEKSALRGGPW